MGSRSNPVQAIEAISWHLNYHVGETLPVNQVAEATGLAWATVQKYTKVIETIQRIAPKVRSGPEGLHVGSQTRSMRGTITDSASSVALYIFVHAAQRGSPSEPLEISEHDDFLGDASDAIEMMESLGWIERSEDTIQLTPLGIQIAGPVYSDLQNGIAEKDVVKVDRDGSEVRAVIESSTETVGSVIGSASTSQSGQSSPRTSAVGEFVGNDFTEPQFPVAD